LVGFFIVFRKGNESEWDIQAWVSKYARKLFSLFRLRVSVVDDNSLYICTLTTDTPIIGYRWGVTSATDTMQQGVSVDNVH
jgi:hypothetical protein